MNQWYSHYIKPHIGDFKKEKSIALLVCLFLAAAAAGGWFWYTSYKKHYEQRAQKILYSCLAEYEKTLAEPTPSKWENIETMCKLGYETNKSAMLAPYFLVVYANVLLAQQKKEEALSAMDDLIRQISSSSPFYYIFKTKYILMKMDTNDEAQQKIAVEELREIAYKPDNKNADEALYYLGEYYWIHKDVTNAQDVWQELIATYFTDIKNNQSPWAQLAQYKIQQISYE